MSCHRIRSTPINAMRPSSGSPALETTIRLHDSCALTLPPASPAAANNPQTIVCKRRFKSVRSFHGTCCHAPGGESIPLAQSRAGCPRSGGRRQIEGLLRGARCSRSGDDARLKGGFLERGHPALDWAVETVSAIRIGDQLKAPLVSYAPPHDTSFPDRGTKLSHESAFTPGDRLLIGLTHRLVSPPTTLPQSAHCSRRHPCARCRIPPRG